MRENKNQRETVVPECIECALHWGKNRGSMSIEQLHKKKVRKSEKKIMQETENQKRVRKLNEPKESGGKIRA